MNSTQNKTRRAVEAHIQAQFEGSVGRRLPTFALQDSLSTALDSCLVSQITNITFRCGPTGETVVDLIDVDGQVHRLTCNSAQPDTEVTNYQRLVKQGAA